MMENNKNKTDGLEKYARNIVNNGNISSDTHAKIITEDYNGNGNISVNSNREKIKWWEKNWVQVIFLVSAIAGIYMLFR